MLKKGKPKSMCDISTSICSSPIGRLVISYCSEGLHSLNQISTINDKKFQADSKSIENLFENLR